MSTEVEISPELQHAFFKMGLDLPLTEDNPSFDQVASYYFKQKEFENNPNEIWDTNIFGKSLNSLVNEGLNNKLYRMPEEARDKFRETIERVINEGCSGLICIIL